MGVSFLAEKRGLVKQLFEFYTTETVPTIRIQMRGEVPVLELGKRARRRDNSIVDGIGPKKGWDITSSPIPMIHGKQLEMGYITHPAGCTVNLVPVVKVRASDEFGNPVQVEAPKLGADGNPIKDSEGNVVMEKGYRYIEANFEGIIGVHSDLDDFNESTEREQSRGWIMPLLVGIIAGVVFFAPLFAWLMSFASKAAGHG